MGIDKDSYPPFTSEYKDSEDCSVQNLRIKFLLFSILERALLDATDLIPENPSKSDSVQRDRRQALAWIMERFDEDKPVEWSYYWICLHLDLDPHLIRQKVKSQLDAKDPFIKSYRHSSILSFAEIQDESQEPILRKFG